LRWEVFVADRFEHGANCVAKLPEPKVKNPLRFDGTSAARLNVAFG
jgi:hypothetical protein